MASIDLPMDRSTFALRPTARYLCIETDSLAVKRYLELAYARIRLPSMRSARSAGALDRGVLRVHPPASCRFNNVVMPLASLRQQPISRASAILAANELFWNCIALDDRWLSLYGCALTVGTRAVILAAPSRTGKTTLAMSLLARGTRLHSDEIVCIRHRDLLVSGLQRTLVMREPSVALLGDDRIARFCQTHRSMGRAHSRVWHFMEPEEIFGTHAWSEPSCLGAVIFLETSTSTSAKIRELNKTAGTARLFPLIKGAAGTVSEIATLRGAFSGVCFFTLTLGQPTHSAQVVLEALSQC
ncbi:MAG: hypothetical protein M3Z14_07935 [Candidatus Eremiobacteraeota bacterium]|nr:hypothetical protein [Candidatus Eremiobacteraeota bacterium]